MKKQNKSKKLSPKSVFDDNLFWDGGVTDSMNFMNQQAQSSQFQPKQFQGFVHPEGVGIKQMKQPTDWGKIAGQGLAVGQGAMQLGSQMASNLSTSGIGREVEGTGDISRDDILNTNINAATNKTNPLGQTASGALTGAKAGASFGPLGAAIGGGIGAIAGGVSSIFGNKAKERAAERAEQQWSQNLQAKDRQFQYQDLRNMMANQSAYGGDLYAYGGQFNKPLIEFNEGGTHEENPNQGVMQGIGQNGKPNLVEEGETRHEDYIFSNRLKIDKNIASAYNLPKSTIGKSFADVSKSLARESKERPNDPISKQGMKAHMAILTEAQDALKQQQDMDKQDNEMINILGLGEDMYAEGGNLFAKGGKHWIQKAINPAHKGYCTPMTKSTCTGRRRALALTFKKHHGFHKKEFGGDLFSHGGDIHDTSDYQRLGIDHGDFIELPSYAEGGDMSHYHRQDGQGFQVYADGGRKSIFDPKSYNLVGRDYSAGINKYQNPIGEYANSIIDPLYATRQTLQSNSKYNTQQQQEDSSYIPDNRDKYTGLDRYAPVAANIGLGISDIFAKPEVTKYGRYAPEKLTSRMDYTPFDTEWMINKLKSQAAATRNGILNTASGNRATAMAGLLGANQQANEAIGDAYMRAAQYNQDRRNQALQFNAAIEQANVGAANQAQLQNLQLQQQEMQANAMARAAQRNAARQAILNAASNIGDIGRENWADRTGAGMFGYETDPITGKIKYNK